MQRISKDLIEKSSFTIFKWAPEEGWPVKFVSKNISQYGYSVKDFLSNKYSFEDIIIKQDKERIVKEVEYMLSNSIDNFKQTYGIYTKLGNIKYIEDQTIVSRDRSGKIIELAGIISDQTELIESKLKISGSKKFLNRVLNEVNLSITIYNTALEELYQNDTLEEMTLSKKSLNKISSELEYKLKTCRQNCTTCKDCAAKFPYSFILKERGKEYEVIFNSFIEEGVFKIIQSIKDISELELTKKQLNSLEQYDSLTKLPNQAVLKSDLEDLVEKNESFFLINIDINDFKKINDNYGLEVGNKLLNTIAKEFKKHKQKREKFSVYRYSGDEFHIIRKVESKEEIYPCLEEIKKVFTKTYKIDNLDITVSASIGVAIYPENGRHFNELNINAEIAMFESKKNRVQDTTISTFFDYKILERNKFEQDMIMKIKEALGNHEFELHYQPQIDIKTEALVGVEALVRWKDPKEGLVPPYRFIPLSEKTGFIIPLGYEILELAFKQLKDWENKGIDINIMAINLSLQQLKEDKFLNNLKGLIKKYEVNTDKVTLEITESYIMDNPTKAIKTLEEIKDLGINLALDDFGTGYSSLSYLKKLPIDKLKIDKSFIDNIVNDKEDQIIVKTIIELGVNFGMNLIAEGVEKEDHRDYLNKTKCNEIQGYFYSKPITAKELEDKYFQD